MFILLRIMNKCSTIGRKLNLCHTKPSITTKPRLSIKMKERRKKKKEAMRDTRHFTTTLALTIVVLSSFF